MRERERESGGEGERDGGGVDSGAGGELARKRQTDRQIQRDHSTLN